MDEYNPDLVTVIHLTRREMTDLIGFPDSDVRRISVSFSPMMQEWSLIVDKYPEEAAV